MIYLCSLVSVSCFGVRVSVMFHFMFVHYTFSSVWVALQGLNSVYLDLVSAHRLKNPLELSTDIKHSILPLLLFFWGQSVQYTNCGIR